MLPLVASLVLTLAQAPATDSGIVHAKGKVFQAEVAREPREQARGLMFRNSLAADRCMIFVYPEDGQHGIWMKNCRISLDVVWATADGTVVEIVEGAPPCSPMLGDNCPTYGGNAMSRVFVEFSVGTVKRLGLKKGDRLGWELAFADGGKEKGGALPKGPAPKKK